MKPLRYAAAVENALRKKLEADTGYWVNLQIRTTATGKLPYGSRNSTRWTGWPTFDLNAANDKEIVADYGLGRTAPCSTKPASGHTVPSVRAGLSMNSGCKPAMNVPAPITCNSHRLWMKMRL